ncbi:Sensor protein evgS precursor [uncultured Bacteroides sp.]|uniref:hybrid sensor histidine kinase/response regulator transcription factor n=1 Tax=Bacteroides cellulolyticus TaxID=2981780 RepID=UPI000820B00C|nr:two-component regulator propeller domain-containing protein [Bacteroides cellulolyticus]MCU6771932.1 response regulator [Bacteroides cellulolyticus]SCI11030.1 Sensor protein evgS precursor [uncultured Bacteroides sp.]
MKYKLSGLIILIFFFTNILAQTSVIYTTGDHISSSLINNIYQDKRGFIWIATEYGLNKFDGNRFTLYTHDENDSTSICNNYSRVVYEDMNDNIWIGTVAGMMKYNSDENNFMNVRLYINGKITIPHISDILERKNGEIWATTSNQGLFKIDTENNTGSCINEIRRTGIYKVNTIIEDNDGIIWIGTEDHGVITYDTHNNKIDKVQLPGVENCNITSMTLNANGDIYIATFTKGLYIFNKGKNSIDKITSFGNLPIKTLALCDNKLYIGTDGAGVKIYREDTKQTQDLYIADAAIDLKDTKAHSILFDKEGNLWFGIFQKGVVFIPKKTNPFRFYGGKQISNSPIDDGCVMSILKNSKNNILIGVDSKGLYFLNSNYGLIKHYTPQEGKPLFPNTIINIFEDSSNNIWLGSYSQGIGLFDTQSGTFNRISGLENESVFSIAEDHNRNLYISTYGTGMCVYNLDSKEITYFKESDKDENGDCLADNWINTLYCDSEGYIWIGHFKGVSCFNPKNKSFINFTGTNYIIKDKMCYSILEDSEKTIWLGTSEGLYSFNKSNKEIKQFGINDGLSNDVICGLCEDNSGHIWISTFNGISKFSKRNNTFTNYYSEDGLQGNEFTRGAAYKSANGEILFGGTNGITCFYPSEITDSISKPSLTISDFQVFGKSINTNSLSGGKKIISEDVTRAKTFRLSHKDNTFRVLFTTMDYGSTSHILYKYRIGKLSKNWLSTRSGENYITFNNLPPGDYTLEVFAVNRNITSDTYVYNIHISYPWYQTWWAYILFSIPVIILIWLTVNYIRIKIRRKRDFMEIRHAREINEAKLQFFINISHEIRTPMTLIINPLEKLIAANNDKETSKTYMMIYRNAKRILRLINQLMDIRKIEKGQMQMHFRETDLVGFINDLMITFENTARQKNISFSFEHEDETLMGWIDINNFDKVLMNLLSNAFKYTPDNGKVCVSLCHGENPNAKGALKNYIEIKVTDSGIGLDENQKERIFERFYQISGNGVHNQGGTGVGLHLTRSLVEMHYGTITAENNIGSSGSTFTVRIPKGCDHISLEQIEENDTYVNNDINIQQISSSISDINEEENTVKKKSKTNFTILIVDDEKEIQEFLKDELSDEFRISLASNGREAYEHILTNHVDLVVSDVMMDEMDGLTLCKKIKQNVNINHIPVILLTAKGKTEEQVEGIEHGADAYIIKPFNTEVLRSTILNLLNSRRILKNKFSGAQEQKEKVKDINIKSSDEALMDKIMSVINNNMSEPTLNVEMLAQEVGLSRVHLHRKLKELTNLSTRDFIKNIRMQQAAKLLKEKKLGISEVAYAVGFSNLSHFSSTFKEIFGVSPKEYTSEKYKMEEEKAQKDKSEKENND